MESHAISTFVLKTLNAQIKYIFFSILRKSLNNSQIRAVIVFVKSASYACRDLIKYH